MSRNTLIKFLTLYFWKINVKKQPPDMSCEKSALKNFAKFTGKHMCWSLFLIKLQAPSNCILETGDYVE